MTPVADPPRPSALESDNDELREDEEMRAASDKPATSQGHLERAMVECLCEFLRMSGKQFIG